MADYQSIFQPYYLNGWENQPSENTPIMGESLDAYDETLQSIESFLSSRLPLSVGYSVYSFLYGDGTLRISLLDRYGSELNRNDVSLGGMITDLSFADGILTATYKSGDTKEVDITSLLDMIVPDITTTDSTTQPNSYAGREMVLEIGGVTEQDSTEGNQLFKFADGLNTTIVGVTAKDNGDGTLSLIGTSTMSAGLFVLGNEYYGSNAVFTLKAGTYYVSGIPSNIGFFLYKTGSEVSPVVVNAPGGSFTLAEDTNFSSISLRWANNMTFNESAVKIMLNVGTTALPWEPYTGGIPAPNPSYPMEIKKSVVSGIRTHKKNFWDYGDITYPTHSGIPWKVSKGTYTFSCETSTFNLTLRTYFVDGTSKVINFTKSPTTFELENDVVSFNYNSIQESTITNIQVEEGTEATPYEPYTESSYTFSQPIELDGKDGVQEVIEDGVIKRRHKSVTNRTFSVIDGYDVGGSKLMVAQIADKAPESWSYNLYHSLCTKLPAKNMLSLDEDGFYLFNYAIYARIAGCSDVSEFNAKMSDAVFVYELETPTTEALPIADQIGLNSLATYDGITYVEFVYDELEPTFKGKYGTSEVGGMTLESLLVARNNELRLTAVENAVVNNI